MRGEAVTGDWWLVTREEKRLRMKIAHAFLAALLVLFAVCASPPAYSQGCAMCSSYVEANSQGGQRAVNKGVLVLLLPPAGFMTLGLAAAFRYSRKRDHENR